MTSLEVDENHSEELLETIKKCNDENEKVTQTLLREYNIVSDIYDAFESLAHAKYAAGIRDTQVWTKIWQEASREEILNAIEECHEAHGKVTQKLLQEHDKYPTLSSIENEFGNLSKAKLESNIENPNQIRFTDEQLEKLKPELLEQLEACERKYGKVNQKLISKDDEFWNPNYFKRAFGTLSKAKLAADLDDHGQIHLTDKELEELNSEIQDNSYKQYILIGLVMGDAWVDNPENKSPRIGIEMANREFLKWVSEELGAIAKPVRKRGSASELAEKNKKYGYTVNEENYSDMYVLRTRGLPYLERFAQWYGSGEKRFPDTLELNSTICKIWYCCDGSLVQNEYSVIYVANEIDRPKYLENLFEPTPVAPSVHQGGGGTIQFKRDETPNFLEWLGDAPPGFEYKWDLE